MSIFLTTGYCTESITQPSTTCSQLITQLEGYTSSTQFSWQRPETYCLPIFDILTQFDEKITGNKFSWRPFRWFNFKTIMSHKLRNFSQCDPETTLDPWVVKQLKLSLPSDLEDINMISKPFQKDQLQTTLNLLEELQKKLQEKSILIEEEITKMIKDPTDSLLSEKTKINGIIDQKNKEKDDLDAEYIEFENKLNNFESETDPGYLEIQQQLDNLQEKWDNTDADIPVQQEKLKLLNVQLEDLQKKMISKYYDLIDCKMLSDILEERNKIFKEESEFLNDFYSGVDSADFTESDFTEADINEGKLLGESPKTLENTRDEGKTSWFSLTLESFDYQNQTHEKYVLVNMSFDSSLNIWRGEIALFPNDQKLLMKIAKQEGSFNDLRGTLYDSIIQFTYYPQSLDSERKPYAMLDKSQQGHNQGGKGYNQFTRRCFIDFIKKHTQAQFIFSDARNPRSKHILQKPEFGFKDAKGNKELIPYVKGMKDPFYLEIKR